MLSRMAESSIGEATGIAVTGMLIVFSALGLISLFLALMPRLTQWLAIVFPEQDHGLPHVLAESESPDEDEMIAAIGYVKHMEFLHEA